MLTLTIVMVMLVAMLVLGLLGDVLWSRETPDATEFGRAHRRDTSRNSVVEVSAEGSDSVDSLAA